MIVIDTGVEESLSRLKQYAEKHPLSMDDVLDAKNGQFTMPDEQVVFVPVDLRVMFSIDWQLKGSCRHMSVSCASSPGKVPHPEVVKMIMPHLGFIRPLEQCHIFLEEFAPGHKAVDIMEYVDPKLNFSPDQPTP